MYPCSSSTVMASRKRTRNAILSESSTKTYWEALSIFLQMSIVSLIKDTVCSSRRVYTVHQGKSSNKFFGPDRYVSWIR